MCACGVGPQRTRQAPWGNSKPRCASHPGWPSHRCTTSESIASTGRTQWAWSFRPFAVYGDLRQCLRVCCCTWFPAHVCPVEGGQQLADDVGGHGIRGDCSKEELGLGERRAPASKRDLHCVEGAPVCRTLEKKQANLELAAHLFEVCRPARTAGRRQETSGAQAPYGREKSALTSGIWNVWATNWSREQMSRTESVSIPICVV